MPVKKITADVAATYKVLIAGISRPGLSPALQGEMVAGATLGDAARVAKLLDAGRIALMTEDEAATDESH